jgi:starch synthase (maltosyl-transferring)
VRLDRSRFDVAVYSLQARPADDAKSCVPMLEAAGIPVFFLDMTGPWSFVSGFFKLRRLLKKRRPDIFLSFLFHANFLGRLAARSVGVEHIVSGIRVAERRAKWHLTLDRWTSRFVDKYVCVSESVAEFSATVGGLPRSKLVVIPNGVDVERFQNALPADLSGIATSPDTKKAIFIGRLDHQKGIDRLLELAPAWLERCPDWELLIVGGNAPQGGAAKHFLGWRSDIPELLAASDLFVLP